jgi:hypothetical protein
LGGVTACRVPLFHRLVFLLLLLAVPRLEAQRLILEDEPPPAGVYVTAGLGVIDLEPGTGLDIPLGLTAISPRHRVMATVTFLDFALLQSETEQVRYQRFFDSRLGEICIDTSSGQLAPYSRCAGETNALRSFSIDLNVLPVETLIVADKAGSLHAGLGWRADDPRTAYGTIGMFFPAHSGRAVGVRLAMGREFIFLGFAWGLHVQRVLSRF